MFLKRDFRLPSPSSVVLALAVSLPFAALSATAQTAAPPGTGDHFKDTSMFKPPAGARVAVVEFEDLECPACSHASPIVHAAVAHYKIPLVRYDFPLQQHIWSYDAAIWARYLQDKVNPEVANQYRSAVFAAQMGISSKDDMLAFTRRFFQQHNLQMPFVPDPTGQLANEVKADRALGEKMGLQHTPTIVVTSAKQWVQVTDVSQLYQTIEQVMAQAGSAAEHSPAKPTSATVHKTAAAQKIAK
jgi:protein-disulfide isomerase